MTLLTLGLYLPLWFCYGLAQPSFLDNFDSFPAGKTVLILSLNTVCCTVQYCACTGAGGFELQKHGF